MEENSSFGGNSCSHSQKFRAFCGTRRFITVFTRTRHWSISRARRIQSTSTHSVSLQLGLILFYNVRLDLSGLIHSGFPATDFHLFIFFPMCATCPAHLTHLDLTISIISGGSDTVSLWHRFKLRSVYDRQIQLSNMEVSGQLVVPAAFRCGNRIPGAHWICGEFGPQIRSGCVRSEPLSSK
jgi:hypothetical protein